MQNRLKQARKEAGISQQRAAEALNTTQQQIYKYEAGIQEIPLYRAVILAEIYDTSLDWIAGRTDKKAVNR